MPMPERPSLITAYWTDDDDPGWNWRARYFDSWGDAVHEESGGFDGRQGLKLETVVSRARAAAGFKGKRIPVEVYRDHDDPDAEYSK
jgi:hypothetical protein